jgi:tetratricopeptide (TPR) repeat protein
MKRQHNSAIGPRHAFCAPALFLALFLPGSARAQDQPAPPSRPGSPNETTQPSKPAPPPAASPSQSSSANSDQDPNKTQVYDPYHAMKAMEVGEFYLKKGDADAAIDRFQDAIQYKYDFARPRLLLAQIYDKRHDDAKAIRYYTEYLKILPQAPDARKIRERIEKLSRQMQAADARQPSQR